MNRVGITLTDGAPCRDCSLAHAVCVLTAERCMPRHRAVSKLSDICFQRLCSLFLFINVGNNSTHSKDAAILSFCYTYTDFPWPYFQILFVHFCKMTLKNHRGLFFGSICIFYLKKWGYVIKLTGRTNRINCALKSRLILSKTIYLDRWHTYILKI